AGDYFPLLREADRVVDVRREGSRLGLHLVARDRSEARAADALRVLQRHRREKRVSSRVAREIADPVLILAELEAGEQLVPDAAGVEPGGEVGLVVEGGVGDLAVMAPKADEQLRGGKRR